MKKILIALLCTIIIMSAMTVVAFAEEEIPSSVDTNTSEVETTEENLKEDLKSVLIILAESNTKGEAIEKIIAINPDATIEDVAELVDAWETMSSDWDCRECVVYALKEGLEYGLEAEWIEWYLDTYFPELPESCEPYMETPTDAPTDAPTETPAETPWLTTEQIVEWIYANYDSITIILTVVGGVLLIAYRLSLIIKTVTISNNNAVAVAENCSEYNQEALVQMKNSEATVAQYKGEISNLLAEIRQSDAEKKLLTKALAELENYLKTAKFANVELANEMAELLVLANIPNSKKDELYARHRAAVDALDAIELTAKHTEVKDNDGEES